MHHPPAEGTFSDEHGKSLKPSIVQHYNRHTAYVDRGDHVTNSYSISRKTSKWMKKRFSPPGCDNTEQIHSPQLLWCKIFPLGF